MMVFNRATPRLARVERENDESDPTTSRPGGRRYPADPFRDGMDLERCGILGRRPVRPVPPRMLGTDARDRLIIK